MQGTRDDHAKRNNPDLERQIPHILSYAESRLKRKCHKNRRGITWGGKGPTGEGQEKERMMGRLNTITVHSMHCENVIMKSIVLYN
jgi:hypothetical protein